MATIGVNISVQVSSGPQISIPSQKIEGVEAYKKFEFILSDKSEQEKKQDVELGENLIFLLISSDDLESKFGNLIYMVGDETDKITLDAPHIYLKAGVSILKKPKKLTFEFTPKPTPGSPDDSTSSTGASNASTQKVEEKKVKVEVLAGYELKPPEQVSQPSGGSS